MRWPRFLEVPGEIVGKILRQATANLGLKKFRVGQKLHRSQARLVHLPGQLVTFARVPARDGFTFFVACLDLPGLLPKEAREFAMRRSGIESP